MMINYETEMLPTISERIAFLKNLERRVAEVVSKSPDLVAESRMSRHFKQQFLTAHVN